MVPAPCLRLLACLRCPQMWSFDCRPSTPYKPRMPDPLQVPQRLNGLRKLEQPGVGTAATTGVAVVTLPLPCLLCQNLYDQLPGLRHPMAQSLLMRGRYGTLKTPVEVAFETPCLRFLSADVGCSSPKVVPVRRMVATLKKGFT